MKYKTALITGDFNVIHPGYLRLFVFAKGLANILRVGIFSDDLLKKETLYDENARLENVLANSFVDEAQIINENLKKFILRTKPDIIIKGKEHENNINPEAEWIKDYGGNLIFSSGDMIQSPEDFNKINVKNLPLYFSKTDLNFFQKRSIKVNSLIKKCEAFNNLKICVIGDLIIDKYIDCQALGMSREDPTLVVSPINEKMFIGGAGIVASHAAAFGAKVDFYSVVGDDDEATFARSYLDKHLVNNQMLIDKSRPTTLKTRFRAEQKTLLRVSKVFQNSISHKLQNEIFNKIYENISKYELFVFSDFNYGCLPTPLVERLTDLLLNKNIFTVADSQTSSQVGDVSRFKNISLLCSTEHEARVALQDMESGLGVLIEKLQSTANPKNIILKLGSEGILLNDFNCDNRAILDRLKSFNKAPVDVSGAGDSLMMIAGMCMAKKGTIFEASVLGSLAAAIQISREGNIPVNKGMLLNAIRTISKK